MQDSPDPFGRKFRKQLRREPRRSRQPLWLVTRRPGLILGLVCPVIVEAPSHPAAGRRGTRSPAHVFGTGTLRPQIVQEEPAQVLTRSWCRW